MPHHGLGWNKLVLGHRLDVQIVFDLDLERRGSETEDRPLAERGINHAFGIYESAVGAALVDHEEDVLFSLEQGVPARHRRMRHHDIAVGLAADQGFIGVDHDGFSLGRDQAQHRH